MYWSNESGPVEESIVTMAMMDNPTFLLAHLRNSFITSDDTGICEIILEGEEAIVDKPDEKPEKPRPSTWHSSITSDSVSATADDADMDTELAHSFDIVPDMDFASHRRRSNTAQRLEKLKHEKHQQSKIRHVQWKTCTWSQQDSGKWFEKKEIKPKTDSPGAFKKRSKFAMQLETFDVSTQNAFIDFAKFDGRASLGLPTKKIDIFLTMALPRDRPYPMTVVTLASAKVQELIGLICWQYTQAGRQPSLEQTDVEAYSLYMAEDDGEVDHDFPALDHREPMSKFGFAKLALVAKEVTKRSFRPSYLIKVFHADSFTNVTLDSDAVTLKKVMEMVLEQKKIRQRRGMEYQMEKKSDAGVCVDLDASVGSLHTKELVLVRQNSVREDLEREDVPHNEITESLSSHQYKSYMVKLSHKLPIPHYETDIQLGIAGEKIEIDPVAGKSKLFRQKAVTYDTENIAACSLLEEKASGKATFKLVYLKGHNFKELDFECDAKTAKEIVAKINNILEMRSSPVRKEYISHKEKKMSKRHNLVF